MIQQRTAAKVSTPICSLLKKGRQFYFSGTVRNGYSENKALDARKRYILQGESAVNDADWLQIDKYNWISYINEGLYSHQSCTPNQPCGHVADKYYDLPFTIQSCHATNLIAQSGSLTFSFPHLILTMQSYCFSRHRSVHPAKHLRTIKTTHWQTPSREWKKWRSPLANKWRLGLKGYLIDQTSHYRTKTDL